MTVPHATGQSAPSHMCFCRKEDMALHMIQLEHELWFRDQVIDDRDRLLLAAERPGWIDFSKGSFLRKLYHMKRGEGFSETVWNVEENENCKKLVHSAGATLVGYRTEIPESGDWASMAINVNVQGTPTAGFDWGFLSTDPENARLFCGPASTCNHHPWDAMILRDCTANTDTLIRTKFGQRKFDLLLMKMCEDYDHPWVLIAAKDSGLASERYHPDRGDIGCVLATEE